VSAVANRPRCAADRHQGSVLGPTGTDRHCMTAPIPSTVFMNAEVYLRVWFSDGTAGFQQLSPDQRIASAGSALVAGALLAGTNAWLSDYNLYLRSPGDFNHGLGWYGPGKPFADASIDGRCCTAGPAEHWGHSATPSALPCAGTPPATSTWHDVSGRTPGRGRTDRRCRFNQRQPQSRMARS